MWCRGEVAGSALAVHARGACQPRGRPEVRPRPGGGRSALPRGCSIAKRCRGRLGGVEGDTARRRHRFSDATVAGRGRRFRHGAARRRKHVGGTHVEVPNEAVTVPSGVLVGFSKQ
eukprot:3271505-Prymnesium_polylepis.1